MREADIMDAVSLGTETGCLSESLLQRRLGWGYTRSRLVMDELNRRGALGAPLERGGFCRKFIRLELLTGE